MHRGFWHIFCILLHFHTSDEYSCYVYFTDGKLQEQREWWDDETLLFLIDTMWQKQDLNPCPPCCLHYVPFPKHSTLFLRSQCFLQSNSKGEFCIWDEGRGKSAVPVHKYKHFSNTHGSGIRNPTSASHSPCPQTADSLEGKAAHQSVLLVSPEKCRAAGCWGRGWLLRPGWLRKFAEEETSELNFPGLVAVN